MDSKESGTGHVEPSSDQQKQAPKSQCTLKFDTDTWIVGENQSVLMTRGTYHVGWDEPSSANVQVLDDVTGAKASAVRVIKHNNEEKWREPWHRPEDAEPLKYEGRNISRLNHSLNVLTRELESRGCHKSDVAMFAHTAIEVVEVVRNGKMIAGLEFMNAWGEVMEDARIRRITNLLEPSD